MKIVHWNISKASHSMYALRKYEDALFSHLKELRQDWNIGRIWRREGSWEHRLLMPLAISEK